MTATHQPVPCNLCGSEGGDLVADHPHTVRTPAGDFEFQVRLVCCATCGLVYWTPRMGAALLEQYYRAVFRSPVWPPAAGDARREHIRGRADWLRRRVPPCRLLEIGCAEGFFLQRASELGFAVTGLEPSPVYADVARQAVPDARIVAEFISRYEAPATADVVCSFFVLEHSLDASAFLSQCWSYLRPGGRCFLEVPDVARYGQQTGDMLWHEHTYHFTADTLTRLMARAGFRVDVIESPGPSYPFGMAVLATRQAPSSSWAEGLPDDAARQRALTGFRLHRQAVAGYRAALRAVVGDELVRLRAASSRLAIYGTGAFFDQLFEHTDLRAADVALVVDDDPSKWGSQTRQGLTIQPPERLAGADLILVGSDAFEGVIADRAGAIGGPPPARILRAHAAALAMIGRASTA